MKKKKHANFTNAGYYGHPAIRSHNEVDVKGETVSNLAFLVPIVVAGALMLLSYFAGW